MIRYWRRGTFDECILQSVAAEYPLPGRFAAGDVVLDLGCHIAAFTVLAAEKGARVVAYEACRDSYALACMNTAGLNAIQIRWGAVWRSDVAPSVLRLTPHPDRENTGGASVLFDDEPTHRRSWSPSPRHPPSLGGSPFVAHDVSSVPLDTVLRELGRVRLLKIDVEGAEFPILMTSQELGRVEEIVGELHELSSEQMELLPARARIGEAPYDRELLVRTLVAAGFSVSLQTNGSQWLFSARR